MTSPDLGPFLRAKREACSPDMLPFRSLGPRRVSGLRRDEVAVLAGLSVDYYTRLEQGRETHPSRQVVDALSRVFELGLTEQRYLYRLADLVVDPPAADPPASVSPELQRMMEGWKGSAAYILDPLLDILAMNGLARTLFDQFSTRRNIAEMVFLDRAATVFYPDWKRAAETTVAMLRLTSPLTTNHARLQELLDDLGRNPQFERMWSIYDVVPQTITSKTLAHPALGTFEIDFHAFDIASEPGHQLIVYQAKAVSPLEAYFSRGGSARKRARPLGPVTPHDIHAESR